MQFTLSPGRRAVAAGVVAAGLLIGAFMLGTGQGDAATAQLSSSQGTTPASASARITVTGTGSVSGTPNQLLLSMGVQTNGSSVSGALRGANQAVQAVTRALEGSGVKAADIQTSGLSIYPNYSNSGAPQSYSVSESVSVTLRDLATAGTEISEAVRAGGNATTVDGVSLNLTDTGSLLAAARAKAVDDAKAKANAYANALGKPLGPVVSLSESAPSQPFPVFENAPLAAGASLARPVPVHPGSQQVSVTVTAVFALG
ncbi:MAG TPA: SIMPL domain-containing protein [Streptosporangiaceae bacterium]|nr:SIMPL domain-containing protein [Streptosporangiaceae bacterium]